MVYLSFILFSIGIGCLTSARILYLLIKKAGKRRQGEFLQNLKEVYWAYIPGLTMVGIFFLLQVILVIGNLPEHPWGFILLIPSLLAGIVVYRNINKLRSQPKEESEERLVMRLPHQ